MRTLMGVLLIVGGLAAILLGLLIIVPVGINLPDSWFGIVLVLLLVGNGVWLIHKAARRLKRGKNSSKPAQSENNSS